MAAIEEGNESDGEGDKLESAAVSNDGASKSNNPESMRKKEKLQK